MPSSDFWITIVLRVLGTSALLVIAGFLLRLLVRSGAAERALWQSAAVVLGLFLAAEISGLKLNHFIKDRALIGEFFLQPGGEWVVQGAGTNGSGAPGLNEAGVVPTPEPRAQEPLLWPGILWLGGTTVLAVIRLLQSAACLVVQRRSERVHRGPIPGIVAALLRNLGMNGTVGIYFSKRFRTPVAFGVVSSSIGLPPHFTSRFAPAEQEAILAHEVTHLANHDPLWRLLLDVLCTVCWWNPFAWLLRRNFLNACELAADETSAAIGRSELLANVLVRLAGQVRAPFAVDWSAMAGDYRSRLGCRVTRLLESPRGRSARTGRWEAFLSRGAAVPAFAAILVLPQAGPRALQLPNDQQSPWRLVLDSFRSSLDSDDLPAEETAPELTARTLSARPLSRSEKADFAEAYASHRDDRPPALPEETKRTATNATPGSDIDRSIVGRRPVVDALESAAQASGPEPVNEQNEVEQNDGDATISLVEGPTIQVEAKWAEIMGSSTDDFESLGLELASTSNANLHPFAAARVLTLLPGAGWQTNDVPDARISGPHHCALSRPAFENLLRVMEQRTHTDILSAPRLTTHSGREALVQVTDMVTVVTGFSTNAPADAQEQQNALTEKIEFGTTLRLVATTVGNGRIGLKLDGRLREFMGYQDPEKKSPARVRQDGREVTTQVPLPSIRERIYATEAEIGDGESLVLFGLAVPDKRRYSEKVPVVGSIPVLGRLFRSEGEEVYTRHLVLMVTAQMIAE